MTNSREEKTLAWYAGRFDREYEDARSEFHRLSCLYKDVCWYNFETTCRHWERPWRQSLMDSNIELYGYSLTRKWIRGSLVEHGHFPMWYHGRLRDAPQLPPQIILAELHAAKEYMDACEVQKTAQYDWAPGGCFYQELARHTLVGRTYEPTRECVYRRRFSSVE